MKIAIISNTSWNILNFRIGLIQFLQSKGYEVIVIAPRDHTVDEIVAKTKAPFFELNYLSRKGYNPFNELLLIKELYSIFKSQHVNLSISYTIKPNIYSAIAAKLAKSKSIINITGLGFVFLKQSFANTLAKRILKVSLSFANAIVFQNNTDKTLFENKKLCKSFKTHLINGSGINTSIYKPNPLLKTSSQFTFLFIGRLLFDKGIREYAEAAKIISNTYDNVSFQIIGALDDGNPSAISTTELNNWLHNNSQLSYLGNQHDVKPFIEQATAIVLPSYREGIPRVLLEAMAFEKPFITVNSPGCEDLTIDGKNGLLAQVQSKDDLAAKMAMMLKFDNEKLIAMGKYGRKLILEKYDEKIIVQEYLKLILSIT